MKAKLIKINDYYYLQELSKTGIGGSQCERTLGTTNSQGELGKLSKQNCDEIFGVVDVEKYFDEDDEVTDLFDYKAGFNKAMELNKDKQFTIDDVKKAINWSWRKTDRGEHILIIDEDDFIQSLQQPTEIEVVIEMETKKQLVNGYRNQPDNVIGFVAEYENILVPKLDSEGCLILTKKI